MHSIDHIESLTKTFAADRDMLAQRLQELRDEQEQAKRRRLIGIKNALRKMQASHAELKEALSDSPDLFLKPKTRTLHGIRVGYVKQRGKLEIADNQVVVKLIRKHFPQLADTLIKTTETPVKPALANMAVKDLQRLGVSVTDDVDEVVIKAADSELDKLIDALAGDAELEDMT